MGEARTKEEKHEDRREKEERKNGDTNRDREQQVEEEHTASTLGWDFMSSFLLKISPSSSSTNLNSCLVKQIGLGFMRSS